MDQNLIKLDGVKKVFYTDEVETHALGGIHLEIVRGEYVSIAGPSGCGKSTLLSIFGLLDTPTGGEYWLNGKPVAKQTMLERARTRNREIGFIFQNFNLIEALSVQENVELALQYMDVTVAERRRRAVAMLEKLGVAHRARHRPSQLSGGQQQRVAIARAMVPNPAVLLADEPTGNLDTARGEEVMRLLRQINGEGTTIVMVTHSPAHAAQASRTVRLLDGRVVVDALHAA